MKNIEKIKKRTEEGLKIFKETAERIALTMEREARIGKKYLDIRGLKKEIENLYKEIGSYFYEEVSAGKKVDSSDPFLLDKISLIEGLKKEIIRIEEEIRKMRLREVEKGE